VLTHRLEREFTETIKRAAAANVRSLLTARLKLEAAATKTTSVQYSVAEDNIKRAAEDDSRNTLPARLVFVAKTRKRKSDE
jgi:hypothetical protein